MHWFILAALMLASAVLLWYTQSAGGPRGSVQAPPPEERDGFRQWLDAPGVSFALERAVEALVELMAHPQLGGPGFLTLRLPQPGEEGLVTVTAQYPNIREALYRRVVRGELDQGELLAAGLPEGLLALEPRFETDSGGTVVVSLRTAPMDPASVERISGRTDRQDALRLLADRLGRRFPSLEVRPFGAELLLTPVRVSQPR